MTRKIVLLDPLPGKLLQEISNRIAKEEYCIISPLENTQWENFKDAVKDADILVHSSSDITAELLELAPQAGLIVKYEFRPGKADVELLEERGIAYAKVPCMALISVAEFTVMLILVQAKEFIKAYQDTLKETWLPDLQPQLTSQTKYPYNWVGLQSFNTLANRTAGIVGMGIVGKTVAKLLQPFGMKVLYHDIYRLSPEEEALHNIHYVSMEELFTSSDYVTVHLKHTDQTEGIIGMSEFKLMKPTAFFINTSRGRVIDEDALITILEQNSIAGAALDVYRYEPLPSESPLRNLDNVILTPHVAGIPLDANAALEAEIFVEKIIQHKH
jgi:phosphoglycerate dehydrogenase-like enzyme